MTPEEKTEYLRIALALSDIGVTIPTSELIWTLYEGIQKKKGKFTLNDVCKIKTDIADKYKKLEKDIEVKANYNETTPTNSH